MSKALAEHWKQKYLETCRAGEEFRKESRRLTDSLNKLNLEIVAQAERVRGLERKLQEISEYNGEITARSMDQETENVLLREALEAIARPHGQGMGVHNMDIRRARELAQEALRARADIKPPEFQITGGTRAEVPGTGKTTDELRQEKYESKCTHDGWEPTGQIREEALCARCGHSWWFKSFHQKVPIPPLGSKPAPEDSNYEEA